MPRRNPKAKIVSSHSYSSCKCFAGPGTHKIVVCAGASTGSLNLDVDLHLALAIEFVPLIHPDSYRRRGRHGFPTCSRIAIHKEKPAIAKEMRTHDGGAGRESEASRTGAKGGQSGRSVRIRPLGRATWRGASRWPQEGKAHHCPTARKEKMQSQAR